MNGYIYLADVSGILLTDSQGVFLIDASSVMLQLITDRTQEDVNFIRKLNELGFMYLDTDEIEQLQLDQKGAYNASDLNRVESFVQYLAEKMDITGNHPIVNVKTVWTNKEWVTVSESQRYLHNIKVLRNVLAVPGNLPEVPQDLEDLYYTEANDIERILEMIDEMITNISKSWYYSNDLFSGEV